MRLLSRATMIRKRYQTNMIPFGVICLAAACQDAFRSEVAQPKFPAGVAPSPWVSGVLVLIVEGMR